MADVSRNAQGVTNVTGQTFTVAQGGVLQIATVSALGMCIVVNISQNAPAMFSLQGARGATAEHFDPIGVFSQTKDTVGTNIYWDAGLFAYVLQNNQGSGNQSYKVIYIGVL